MLPLNSCGCGKYPLGDLKHLAKELPSSRIKVRRCLHFASFTNYSGKLPNAKVFATAVCLFGFLDVSRGAHMMRIQAQKLESGYWVISGAGLCNFSQPPEWPTDENTLRAHAFPGACEDFFASALYGLVSDKTSGDRTSAQG
jgi:hypothetical protein